MIFYSSVYIFGFFCASSHLLCLCSILGSSLLCPPIARSPCLVVSDIPFLVSSAHYVGFSLNINLIRTTGTDEVGGDVLAACRCNVACVVSDSHQIQTPIFPFKKNSELELLFPFLAVSSLLLSVFFFFPLCYSLLGLLF